METFQISVDTDDMYYCPPEPIVPSGSMYPYINHVPILCIMNKTGSNKIVNIRKIEFTPLHVASAAQNKYALYKITGLVNGIGEIIPIVKLDSNNSNPASQLTSIKNPSSVTTTGDILNVIRSNPAFNMSSALRSLTGFRGNDYNKFGLGLNNWKDASTAQTQKIVLRQGEGICFKKVSDTMWAEVTLSIEIIFRDTSGNCYTSKCNVYTNTGNLYALFNASPSVVYEVLKINISNVSEEWSVNQYTLEFIDLADITEQGEELTPVPMDSTNSLNSYIKIYKNPKTNPLGYGSGGLLVNPILSRIIGLNTLNAIGTATAPIAKVHHLHKLNPDIPINLREGTGIGIFSRSQGAHSKSLFTIIFTQENAGGAPPSAGEHSYTFVG